MPDNGWYYHAAYVTAMVIYVLYSISLFVRRRKIGK